MRLRIEGEIDEFKNNDFQVFTRKELEDIYNYNVNGDLDEYSEEEPGKWYRLPRQKYVGHTEEKDLITRKEYNEISDWFKNNK